MFIAKTQINPFTPNNVSLSVVNEKKYHNTCAYGCFVECLQKFNEVYEIADKRFLYGPRCNYKNCYQGGFVGSD